MFCPICGAADQKPESYCRQCGEFMLNPKRPTKGREQTPQEQFNVTLGFDLLTAIASIAMAIALAVTHLGDAEVDGVILTATVMFLIIAVWQIGSFFTNLKLKRRFAKSRYEEESSPQPLESRETNELLPEPDMSDFVQASVIENTTRQLDRVERLSKSEQKSD